MKRTVVAILLFAILFGLLSGCSNTAPAELGEEDQALILALIEYLEDLLWEYNPVPISFATRVDKIQKGARPLHVGFDASDYYFVCGYYNTTHESEGYHYCCAAEYTWVKFANEKEITEHYKDSRFVVGFRIQKAIFVTDILSETANAPSAEFFQLYYPSFHDKSDVKSAPARNETFIYLNKADQPVVYRAFSMYDHKAVTLPCICLEGQYYIAIYLDVVDSNGDCSVDWTPFEFGEYYDALTEIMKPYRVTDESGVTHMYALFEMNDFQMFLQDIMQVGGTTP